MIFKTIKRLKQIKEKQLQLEQIRNNILETIYDELLNLNKIINLNKKLK
jgi:hypothetical protein